MYSRAKMITFLVFYSIKQEHNFIKIKIKTVLHSLITLKRIFIINDLI